MKNAVRTVVSLLLVFALCAVVLNPSAVRIAIDRAETTRQTRANLQWKAEAEQNGESLQSFEETLYYAQTQERDIEFLTDNIGYVRNEILVTFEDGTSVAQKQKVFDFLGASVIGCADVVNQYQLRIAPQNFVKLQNLCAAVQREKHVVFANCNMVLPHTEDYVYDDPWTNPTYGTPEIQGWEDDDLDGGNWWLTATQTPAAWDYRDYFKPIQVGIMDGGFETDHEDLQGKITFPAKKYEKTNRPASHGTHVAGIISAIGGNQKGIAGICQNANLICVDWRPEDGQFWSTQMRIYTGIIALVKAGAKVLNLSFGSSSGYKKSTDFFWRMGMNLDGMVYSYLIASLLHKGYDFLVVQSAGNGNKFGTPCDTFLNGTFCAITEKNCFTGLTGISKQEILDHILIVGSATFAHEGTDFYMSSFSNYGENVSIFAPGSWVFSTDLTEQGGYSTKSGTSMSAPVATAIAAMTWSVNPNLSAAEVKQIVCDPDNTVYNCVNYYNLPDEDRAGIDIPDCPMINAKLCVEAAIRTLPESEQPTTENETETETTVQANAEQKPHLGKSDRQIVEKFRGELGE